MSRDLRLGNDPNLLELAVLEVDVKPYCRINRGLVENGVIVKISRYNIHDILIQMLEDYPEEKIIEIIKSLR